MNHENELWYITERYAETLQRLVRTKGLNQADRIAHLKCFLATKYVDLNEELRDKDVYIADVGQKLINATESLSSAMTLNDKEEVLKIFNKAFLDVLNIYEDKMLYLLRHTSQLVHDHISKLISEWGLDNVKASKVLTTLRTLKLHPVLAEGVESSEPSDRPIHLISDKKFLMYLDDYLTEVDILLGLKVEGLDYDVFLDDLNNRVYNFMIDNVENLFEASDLKTYNYLLTDSQGGEYSFSSPLPLSTVRDVFSNAWFCNKTGESLVVKIKENAIVNLEIYKGSVFTV